VVLAPAAAATACRSKERPGRAQAPAPRSAPAPAEEDGCQVAQRDAGSGRVLSRAQWEALDAACERILPADADPGARAAGVINYIDAQLVHPPVSSFCALLLSGAAELDRLAGARAGKRFAQLAMKDQEKVLGLLQKSRMGPHSGARFLHVLVVLTLEGFFGDPVYGGNRDRAGWSLIGLSPRSPGARCAYRGAG
jgi:gluconate 2-dehydrogenase gamma chain